MNDNKGSKQLRLPGSEEFFKEDEPASVDHDGKPRSNTVYFDAAQLPDAPTRQKVAHGAQTYIMYIVFPSFEEMRYGMEVLSGGNRKSIAKQATMTTISSLSIHKGTGLTLIDWWKKLLSGETVAKGKPASPKAAKSDDEASEPIFSDEDDGDAPALITKKEVKPVKVVKEKVVKIEIPVVTKFKSKLSVDDKMVFTAFPTYRRSSTVKTWAHFPEGMAIGYVEPQEINTYTQLHEEQNIEVLPSNGMSIAQKRKHITDEAIEAGYTWLFMLEDDFTGFLIRDGLTAGGSHKLVKSDYRIVMNQMLKFAEANKIAQLGLSQQQSNHFYEEEYVKYSCKVTEFCLFNLKLLQEAGVNYDPTIAHFEDFDISVQLLTKGYKVGLYTPAAFGHVTMATNAGGFMTEGMEVRKQQAEKAIEQMIIKYPGIIEKKDGRLFPEPKINWTSLRQQITLE